MLFIANMNRGILVAFSFGPPEMIFIVLVVLLLFGGKKLPELARGLGRGLRFFKEEVKGIQHDINIDDEPGQNPPEQTLPPKADSGEKSDDKPSS